MKAIKRIAGVLFLALGASPAFADGFEDLQEALIGYAVNPVQLNVRGKNVVERVRIGVGAYLVNGPMLCAGCHTAPLFLPGGNPFNGEATNVNAAAFMGGGQPFGPFVSRNLTPDKNGRPAGLTFDQFKQVLRTGVDLKAIPPHVPSDPGLLQVMPWPEFRHATTDTLRAVYDYLSVLPCLEGGPGQLPNRCGP